MRDRWGDLCIFKDQMRNSLHHYRCPICGQTDLWDGPRMGCAVNVLCRTCGTRYNVTELAGSVAKVQVAASGPRWVPIEELHLFPVCRER